MEHLIGSDISYQIRALFARMDVDEDGALAFEEVNAALKKFDFHPPLRLSQV